MAENEEFFSINEDATYQIVIKKSKFIANVFYVESEEEAENKIKQIKKKYYDAKHNCFAFSIIQENKNEYKKCSDDGEPSGTAGLPILNIIEKRKLSNIVVIVTRYFGGILLGTGGLSRAYSESAQKVVQKAEVLEQTIGNEYIIRCGYEDQNEILYELKKQSIKIKNTEYKEKIEITISISKENIEQLKKLLLKC